MHKKYEREIKKLDPNLSLTLDRLCDDFRTEVFKKAGKSFPPVQVCDCSKTLG